MADPTGEFSEKSALPTPQPNVPQWRNQPLQADRTRKRSLLIGLSLVALLAVSLGYLFTYFDPIAQPYLIVIGAAPDGVTIPQWTADERALNKLDSFTLLPTRLGPGSGPAVLGAEFQRRQSEIRGQTVVIYLAASARVDSSSGTPRVVIPGSIGANHQDLFHAGFQLDMILAALRSTEGKPDPGLTERPFLPARVLLILDIHSAPVEPSRAQATEDLNAVLAREVNLLAENNLNLTVLTSADVGQTATGSPALGRSPFGFYVTQGLHGLADASNDRRLNVGELASFVRDRVARWSRMCRGVEQTPWLARGPKTADFAIVTVPATLPPEMALPKEAPAYPDWLLDAWRSRDAGLRAGDDRTAPRPFAQLEAALLEAERAWMDGADVDMIRGPFRARLAQLQSRIKAVQEIPVLPACSLALARASGAVDDPGVVKAARDWLARRPRPTSNRKPDEASAIDAQADAEFLAPLAAKSDFALASAIVEVASTTPELTHEVIKELDRVLAIRQPRPLFVETEAIRRLAHLPVAGWRPERARIALRLTLATEIAQSRPEAMVATRAMLGNADRVRHEAATLLFLPGYSTATDSDRLLVAALATTESCLTRIEKVCQIRRLLDESARLLPAAVPVVIRDDELTQKWLDAALRTRSLADEEASGRLADPGFGQTDQLDANLSQFRSQAIHSRITRLTELNLRLEATDYDELESWMAISLPEAADRVALWRARINLDRRLSGTVLALDRQEGRKLGPAVVTRHGNNNQTVLLDLSTILEAIAGLSGSTVLSMNSSSEPAVGLDPWAARLDQISATDLIRRDRIARVTPPWAASNILDDGATDPSRLRRVAERRDLGGWLAARYQFEAVDPVQSEFFAAAAQDFAAYSLGTLPGLSFAVDAHDRRLTPERPSILTTITLGLERNQHDNPTRNGPAWIDLVWPDAGILTVRPESITRPGETEPVVLTDESTWPVAVEPDRGSCSVLIKLRERTVSEVPLAPESVPHGVLARARWGDRTYHFPIDLEIETAANRPQISLISNAVAAAANRPVDGVFLRPVEGKVGYFLQLKNPSEQDRSFVIDLFDRRGPIAGATVTQTIRAGVEARIIFGSAAPDLEPGMIEIHGPLTIRVADAAHPDQAVTRELPIQLVPLSDLCRVVGGYHPGSGGSDGKSRLEVRVRAIRPITGPAPTIEIQIPTARNPGLIFPGEGTFRGTLPGEGKELVLFAEGLQFDPRASDEGVVYLSVDQIERAGVFLARFPRQGRQTPLIPATQPALRLRGERVARPSSSWPLVIEVDSPPPLSQIELTLGQYSPGSFGDRFEVTERVELDGDRARFRINPRGVEGSIVFDAMVRDSAISLNLAGIRGRRIVRARLLTPERAEPIAEAKLDLIVDDRAPATVRFVEPPRFAVRGGAVVVQAAGSVPESGLKDVVFYVGRPTADGKRPPTSSPVPGTATDPERTNWTATVSVGEARLGPLDITTEFVAGNGLGRSATTTIAIVEVIPIEPGIIEGVIHEGNRPQPGFEVQVFDEKSFEKAKTKTDDRGKFIVKGLAPGKYQVISTKATPPTRGISTAVVESGRSTMVTVPMFRVR